MHEFFKPCARALQGGVHEGTESLHCMSPSQGRQRTFAVSRPLATLTHCGPSPDPASSAPCTNSELPPFRGVQLPHYPRRFLEPPDAFCQQIPQQSGDPKERALDWSPDDVCSGLERALVWLLRRHIWVAQGDVWISQNQHRTQAATRTFPCVFYAQPQSRAPRPAVVDKQRVIS